MNYYKRHIGDYIRDTAHLSLLEHGVYTRLLDVYYTREAPIPADQTYRLAGAKSRDERAAVDAVIEEFFVSTESGWAHKRCDAEISAHREKAEQNRQNGQSGGRPRKRENPTKTQSVSFGNPNETLATSHKPIAIKEKEREREERAPVGSRLPPDFPTPDLLAWAVQQRPDLCSSDTADRFRDYWAAVPGAKGRKADWPATWRNWVRGERAQARASPTALDRQAEVIARMTGGLMGKPATDPRIIDVEFATADPPRLAGRSG